MKKPSYLWAAFKARPLGMPIPPHLFGVAAFGLLGAFLSPGFWLVGAGLELAYLLGLSQSERFRRAVDAQQQAQDPQDQRYRALLDQLDKDARQRQTQIEARARAILATLKHSPLLQSHSSSVEQLVWLHLRLLVAHAAIEQVVRSARAESAQLERQEAHIIERLARDDLSEDLRRSLQQQKDVIDQRQAAHADAGRRLERVDVELGRIEQQIALIHEQALLATDEDSVGASLNALAASFNESNRWLSSQRDLLDMLDIDASQKLPASVLQGPPPAPRQAQRQ